VRSRPHNLVQGGSGVGAYPRHPTKDTDANANRCPESTPLPNAQNSENREGETGNLSSANIPSGLTIAVISVTGEAFDWRRKSKTRGRRRSMLLLVGLLVAMGYGGSLRDAGAAIGRGGDKGIDGHHQGRPTRTTTDRRTASMTMPLSSTWSSTSMTLVLVVGRSRGHQGLPTTLPTLKVGSGNETVEIGRRFLSVTVKVPQDALDRWVRWRRLTDWREQRWFFGDDGFPPSFGEEQRAECGPHLVLTSRLEAVEA
jgi:hypothetical protein